MNRGSFIPRASPFFGSIHAGVGSHEFGLDRLVAELLELRGESLEGSVRRLGQSIETWCAERPLEDDVSILACELDGRGQGYQDDPI